MDESQIPTKKFKKTHEKAEKETCMIHCTDDNSALSKPKDYESWETLHQAAIILKHTPVLEAAVGLQDGAVP